MDDHKARLLAQQERLTVVGTFRVLKHFKERRALDALHSVFDQLRAAEFSMRAEYDEILRQIGEREGKRS
jgi:predicted nucleic acid-binding protein